MRERVAVLGGDIEIGRNGGAGFGVRARLPVPAKT
jgi:signal transduction histidine kinase